MKALTISQPYASKIADGEKWVENRTWPTDHRGLLAVHAGKGTQYLSKPMLARYHTGCIVAVANLYTCVSLTDLREAGRHGLRLGKLTAEQVQMVLQHEHTEGPYCWILRGVRRLERPITIPGAMSLWSVPQRIVAEMKAQLERQHA